MGYDVVCLCRGEKQGALKCVRNRLPPPDRVQVQDLLLAVGIVEHLCHGVGDDVGAVATLVPWLLRNFDFEPTENDRLRDQPPVPELVISGIALGPSFADVLREFGEVLLRSARDDMRLARRRKLELGEVCLAEKLRFREFEIELLLLGGCQAGARVDELPPRPFIEPLRVMAFALPRGEDHIARELLDPDVEGMVREEIGRVHLAVDLHPEVTHLGT